MIGRRDFLRVSGAALAGVGIQSSHFALAQVEETSTLRRLVLQPTTGGAKAVIVGPASLLHTPQIHAWNDSGRIVSPGRVDDQVDAVFKRLEMTLRLGGSAWEDVVRLHVYAQSNEGIAKVRKYFEELIPEGKRPSLTNVVGGLIEPGALVALDAVAVSRREVDPKSPLLINADAPWSKSAARQGLLPHGRKLYISGQAEKGASLRECTRATMESLKKTLEMFNLGMEHTVQVKSFMTPITGKAEVEDEIVKFFPADRIPPLVYVEWKSTLPIEIELVATVPEGKFPAATSQAVEYHTPKGLTSSPIFSRVALTNSKQTIYTGGVYGKPGSAEAQVRDIFAQLQQVTTEAGSDLKHLVKATYYVASDDASGKLNAVRPEFYDPQRPPAASKAMVAGVGLSDRGITLDMIAVPTQS